jgi:transcriptional regulator with XRE-family HTH domain
MIAARMRECLRLLRWSETDFAEEAGYAVSRARNWLCGRERPPLGVVAGWRRWSRRIGRCRGRACRLLRPAGAPTLLP